MANRMFRLVQPYANIKSLSGNVYATLISDPGYKIGLADLVKIELSDLDPVGSPVPVSERDPRGHRIFRLDWERISNNLLRGEVPKDANCYMEINVTTISSDRNPTHFLVQFYSCQRLADLDLGDHVAPILEEDYPMLYAKLIKGQ